MYKQQQRGSDLKVSQKCSMGDFGGMKRVENSDMIILYHSNKTATPKKIDKRKRKHSQK